MKNRFITVLVVVGAVHLLAGGGLLAYHLVTQPDSPPGPATAGPPAERTDFAIRQPGAPAAGAQASRPPSSPAAAAPSTTAKTGTTPSGATAALPASHTVAPGEGYIVIARKYGITVEQLLSANGHQVDRTLRVGESLRLPSRPSP